MKKIPSLMLAVLLCFLMGCSAAEEEVLIAAQSSPDGRYEMILYQVGSPVWSFGPVKARLVLKDSEGRELREEEISLQNDGAGVSEWNVKEIVWRENQAEVVMREADTSREYSCFFNYK